MFNFLLSFGVFLFAGAALYTGYTLVSDLFFRDRRRIDQRLDDQFRDGLRKKAEKSSLFRDFTEAASVADESRPPTRRERFHLMLEQSGLNIKPMKLFLMMGVAGFVVGLATVGLTKNPWMGLAAVPAGVFCPWAYVGHKVKQRRNKMLSQLPDAFDLMARAVRAGNTFWQAMLSASQEFEAPISLELGYCHEMQNLGLPHEAALRDLARRTGLVEMRILSEAVTIQEQTGGNLAEILDKLTIMVRERFRIWGKVRTLTAEGQMQALVLLALAPGMFVLMLFVNYDYARMLIDWHGSVLLFGTVICEGLGWLWIRKIVNFDF